MPGYFPSVGEVQNFAGSYHEDPINVFAFAAEHQRLPSDDNDMRHYMLTVIEAHTAQFALPTTAYVAGYIQAMGSEPQSFGYLAQYLGSIGALNPATNVFTGNVPYAGLNYPPGGATTPAGTPAPVGAAPAALSPLAWIQSNPLPAGAGAVLALVLFGGLGGRRR